MKQENEQNKKPEEQINELRTTIEHLVYDMIHHQHDKDGDSVIQEKIKDRLEGEEQNE